MIKTGIVSLWKIQDYLIYFVLMPFILVIIYLLPLSVKNTLILVPNHPTVLSTFFSNYAHSSFSHLWGNLFTYLLIFGLIFKIEVDKKFFYLISALNLLILPFLSSLLVIYFLPDFPFSQGFSAITSAFIGYFLYSVFNHLKMRYTKKLNSSFIWLTFMANLLIWSFVNFKVALVIPVLLVTAYFFFHIAFALKVITKKLLNNIYKEKFLLRTFHLFIFAITILFLFPILKLVPNELRINIGTTANAASHYLGYCFGVFTPLFVKELKKFIPRHAFDHKKLLSLFL